MANLVSRPRISPAVLASGVGALFSALTFSLSAWGTEAAEKPPSAPPSKDLSSDAATAKAATTVETQGDVAVLSPAESDKEPDWERKPAERRSGFTAGVLFGVGGGRMAGYPAQATKIGRAAYRTDTGAAFAGGGTIWLGAALSDWLIFGPAFDPRWVVSGEHTLQSYNALFHTEFYPLWALGGHFREVGLFLDTGVGFGWIPANEKGKVDLVEGMGVSLIGVGAFYEGIRLSKLSMGPFVSFEYLFGDILTGGEGLIGWRTAVYTGP